VRKARLVERIDRLRRTHHYNRRHTTRTEVRAAAFPRPCLKFR
jgi:hypothetical protein